VVFKRIELAFTPPGFDLDPSHAISRRGNPLSLSRCPSGNCGRTPFASATGYG